MVSNTLLLVIVSLLGILMFLPASVHGLAVMSVDLGGETLKIAIVSPGKPMEIILNVDSQRKTPLAVGFRDGDRFFGEAAMTTSVRFPEKVFMYIMDLIGKDFDNPLVKTYQERFPFTKLSKDNYKNTVLLHHPEEMTFTPEELLAMLLERAKYYAERASDNQAIKDVVITVPPYFNQAERRAVMRAARIAGLKVLQLINSNTAVALNYGVFRRKDFNESLPTHVLFYEMGSTSTVATVAAFQLVKTKELGFVETNPQLTIKGVGYDRTLGGLEMQIRLRDHLVKLFSEQSKKSLEAIKSNKRAMSKLFKEAGRLKKVLSANTEHMSQIENVMEDVDFKHLVKRSEFEEICADLLNERLILPIRQALSSSGITMDEIEQLILFGGSTRVPKVQQTLMETLNLKELGKSVNADEAAALGAAYQAAHLSKGFKVKTFIVKDANLLPIQVDFQRAAGQDDGSTKMKTVHKILFSRNNLYPQKKVLTFSRHTDDFEFNVNYANLQDILSPSEIACVGSPNISKVSVKGVAQALAKHADKEKENKGIKAHFRMTDSGILTLESVEANFETKVKEVDQPEGDTANMVKNAFAKIGDSLSNFFGGSKVDNSTNDFNETSNVNETAASSSDTSTGNVTNGETDSNTTFSGSDPDKSAIAEDKKAETKFRLKTIKEPLVMEVQELDLQPLSDTEIDESIKLLAEIGSKEQAKHRRDAIKNTLESFIVEFKMKLHESEYESASTKDERDSVLNEFSSANDWLENESEGASSEVFEQKLESLKSAIRNIVERVTEHRERPEAVSSLKEFLNASRIFYNGAVNVSSEQQIFTNVELSTLENLISTTQDWLDTSLEEQAKIPLYESPKLLVRNIREKISLLDREVKYLINKARASVPKKPVEEPSGSSSKPEGTQADQQATDSGIPDVTQEGVVTTEEVPLELPESATALPQTENTIKHSETEKPFEHTEL